MIEHQQAIYAMAGHSKWANIKHRKAGQDARRGKMFTKIIRELSVAAREGSDADSNPRLRTALDKALANNMKRDTIDKAIARGSGAAQAEYYEAIRYEGYGPQGIAYLVDCLTDNRQRTVSDVRHAFVKHGGNLGTDGSVVYLFKLTGVLRFSHQASEDQLLEILLQHDIDDLEITNQTEKPLAEVHCAADKLGQLRAALLAKQSILNINIQYAESDYLATNPVSLDLQLTQKNLNLIEWLEDLDDVQRVHTNLVIEDSLADQLQ